MTELVQDVLPKVKGGLAVAVIGDHWCQAGYPFTLHGSYDRNLKFDLLTFLYSITWLFVILKPNWGIDCHGELIGGNFPGHQLQVPRQKFLI